MSEEAVVAVVKTAYLRTSRQRPVDCATEVNVVAAAVSNQVFNGLHLCLHRQLGTRHDWHHNRSWKFFEELVAYNRSHYMASDARSDLVLSACDLLGVLPV
jgi:hypothetical protein